MLHRVKLPSTGVTVDVIVDDNDDYIVLYGKEELDFYRLDHADQEVILNKLEQSASEPLFDYYND